MSTPRIRVYGLFPGPDGRLSCRTLDYQGTTLYVAATSVRQAYKLAGAGVWISPETGGLLGLIAAHRDSRGTGVIDLWDGCQSAVRVVRHGDGVRAIRAAVERHDAECPAAP